MKRIFYTEAAYLLGLLILASGTTLMAAADFGVSMVAAPAYVFYRKLSLIFPWFTFGMAEYLFQAVVLLLLAAVMGRFRGAYLFSFVTTVAYGLFLDTAMRLTAPIPVSGWAARGGCYLLGTLLCALGVTLLFHTYFPPAAYELAVKELTRKTGLKMHRIKTVYGCVSCGAAVILSFVFFGAGQFVRVRWGTVLCALVNGWLIGRCTAFLEEHWEFQDGLELRARFS